MYQIVSNDPKDIAKAEKEAREAKKKAEDKHRLIKDEDFFQNAPFQFKKPGYELPVLKTYGQTFKDVEDHVMRSEVFNFETVKKKKTFTKCQYNNGDSYQG